MILNPLFVCTHPVKPIVLFINNKDLNSQIKYIIVLTNK